MGLSNRIAYLLVLPLAVALWLNACSHSTGEVTVGIVYIGGPNPAVLAHRWQPGVVRVFRADGSFVTSRRLGEGDSLTTQLPPGSYRVVGRSGDATCISVSFNLSGGGRILVRVACSIK